MDTSSVTELTMEPPKYSVMENTSSRKKTTCIAGTVTAIVVTALIAVLLGVFLTQKHYETILQTIMKGQNGKDQSLVATVNNRENVVTFYVSEGNVSATLVYDYAHSVIGYKATDKNVCFISKMDKERFPSLNEILDKMKNPVGTEEETQQLVIIPTQLKVVDRTVLGQTINILCNEVNIYWAQETRDVARVDVHFEVCWKTTNLSVCLAVTIK
ncbi:pulmonary surfactant-associated protein C-like [Protopterus annectens]|uniref:pulmonary surfactant-associated protein C-like n=1 Tax=Protopterus annectens TaxID=7888 RepID=UPI001CFA6439|nr:pulmonary surfactant-associated protein C-like [Protopterus annectens]